MSDDRLRITVAGGKYTVVQDANGRLSALRYGEPWRDCCGDNLIFALASDLAEVQAEIERLKAPQKPIKCSDRMPNSADTTNGILWVYAPEFGWRLDYWFNTVGITHWQPTGLTRPEPPKGE